MADRLDFSPENEKQLIQVVDEYLQFKYKFLDYHTKKDLRQEILISLSKTLDKEKTLNKSYIKSRCDSLIMNHRRDEHRVRKLEVITEEGAAEVYVKQKNNNVSLNLVPEWSTDHPQIEQDFTGLDTKFLVEYIVKTYGKEVLDLLLTPTTEYTAAMKVRRNKYINLLRQTFTKEGFV